MSHTEPRRDPSMQIQRWRSPLLIGVLAGWLFAVLSGSVLLFFILAPTTRDWWALLHWSAAVLALPPYAIYQLRHYRRVRAFSRQTHHRVGLHAFWLVCGVIFSGLLLIAPLPSRGRVHSLVDLAHIFFGFAFTLLLSAHLTLVAMLTLARAGGSRQGVALRAIARALAVAATLASAALLAAHCYPR